MENIVEHSFERRDGVGRQGQVGGLLKKWWTPRRGQIGHGLKWPIWFELPLQADARLNG